MNKLILAFKMFFLILTNGKVGKEIEEILKKEKLPEIEEKKKENTAEQFLMILQREARFVDFLQENLDGFDDSQIGAVARTLHTKCKKTMENYVKIEPLFKEEEGSNVTIEKGFDPSEIRLIGNVSGNPPFKGRLGHHGWKAVDINLPALPEGQKKGIIEPAEVEI
jgi:hypothetical protein